MSVHDKVLEAAARLVRQRGTLPSLDEIARAAGVSKGGLLHHFPDRAAVVTALVRQSVARTRQALSEGGERGDAVRTWLRLSVPDGETLAVATAVLAAGPADLPPEVGEFTAWCEGLLEQATGDKMLAYVVRLTGDGLFADSLAGSPPTESEVERLVDFFARAAGRG